MARGEAAVFRREGDLGLHDDSGLTDGSWAPLGWVARDGDLPDCWRGVSVFVDSGLATVNTEGSGFGIFDFLGMLVVISISLQFAMTHARRRFLGIKAKPAPVWSMPPW